MTEACIWCSPAFSDLALTKERLLVLFATQKMTHKSFKMGRSEPDFIAISWRRKNRVSCCTCESRTVNTETWSASRSNKRSDLSTSGAIFLSGGFGKKENSAFLERGGVDIKQLFSVPRKMFRESYCWCFTAKLQVQNVCQSVRFGPCRECSALFVKH